jgi:hypothetical protein
MGYSCAFAALRLSAPLFLALVVVCPTLFVVALAVVPLDVPLLAPGAGVICVPAVVVDVDAVVPVVSVTGTMLVPIAARFIPLEMVAVVTQFDDVGMLKGAAGVLRSPMVYTPPLGSVPVKRCAKVEHWGVPLIVVVGYQPGGSKGLMIMWSAPARQK